jgi:hypothetical protein
VAVCQNSIVPVLEPPLSLLPPLQAVKVTLNATTPATTKIYLGAMKLTPRLPKFRTGFEGRQ